MPEMLRSWQEKPTIHFRFQISNPYSQTSCTSFRTLGTTTTIGVKFVVANGWRDPINKRTVVLGSGGWDGRLENKLPFKGFGEDGGDCFVNWGWLGFTLDDGVPIKPNLSNGKEENKVPTSP